MHAFITALVKKSKIIQLNAIISLSTTCLHIGHFGCINVSSYVLLSNNSFVTFFKLSIFQISQHSLQVCWCWQGSRSIDLLRPQPIMHSILSLGKDGVPTLIAAIAALILLSASPLLVIRSKSRVLSSTSLSSVVDSSTLRTFLFLCVARPSKRMILAIEMGLSIGRNQSRSCEAPPIF